MKDIWSETYRPNTLDNYVFIDDAQEKQVRRWVKEGSIPHLLLSGAPGTGKTTLAKILKSELNVMDHDFMMIDGTKSSGIDIVRDKIIPFIETMPFGEFKIVLIDEADYLSIQMQGGLRGPMQEYNSSARFILTCNYEHKIIPALKSRCQNFHIKKLDQTEFTARVAEILLSEGIEFDIDTLDTYVRSTYPDLRKCINSVDQNSYDGKLHAPKQELSDTTDYKFKATDLIKAGKIYEGRQVICENMRPDEVDELYRWMFDNLELWGDDNDGMDKAINIIAEHMKDVPSSSDQEINASSCLTRLIRIRK